MYYHLLLFCVCIESVFRFKTYWLIDYIMSVSHKLFCCEKSVWAEHDRDKYSKHYMSYIICMKLGDFKSLTHVKTMHVPYIVLSSPLLSGCHLLDVFKTGIVHKQSVPS